MDMKQNASLKVSKEVWGQVKVYCGIRCMVIQKWVEDTLLDAMKNNVQAPTPLAPVQVPRSISASVFKPQPPRQMSLDKDPDEYTLEAGPSDGDGMV